MCKSKCSAVGVTGVVSLVSMLAGAFPQLRAATSTCTNGTRGIIFVDGPYVASPNYVHVGENATVNVVGIGNNLIADSCNLTKLKAWVVYPDSTFNGFLDDVFLAGGSVDVCTSGGGGSADCVAFTATYQVKLTDIANSLDFHTNWPPGFPAGFGPTAPIPNNVQFAVAGAGALTDDSGNAHGFASPQAVDLLTVLEPCVQISKVCSNNCTPLGQPIGFSGLITNCSPSQLNSSDATLFITSVTDDSTATVTIASITSSGRMYDGTLQFGESVAYSGIYQPAGSDAALCGPFADTITVIAADLTGFTVTNSAQATCQVQANPVIALTKDCYKTGTDGNPVRNLSLGDTYVELFTVTNAGNVGLTGVAVTDVSTKNGITTIPFPDLGPGDSTIIQTGPFTVVAGDCPGISDSATVTGTNICPSDLTCPAPTSVSAGPQTCNLTVNCLAQICVMKQIACFLGTNSSGDEVCGTFSHSATGFKVVAPTLTNFPAFCYSITVSNCGQIALTNVSVIDDKFGDLTPDLSCVSGLFAPGGSCSFNFKTSLEFDQTNTVTASGQSIATGQPTSAQDSATGHVFQASIECTKLVSSPDDLDGDPNDSHVRFECGSGEHLVSYSVFVTNSGDADLTNIVISDPTLAQVGCTLPRAFSLAAHQALIIPLCANLPFDCGTGQSGNNCANPILGGATGCTVLQLGGGYSVSVTGPAGGIQGDVCIGPNSKLAITGSQYVTGNIDLAPGATFSKSGSGVIGGTITKNIDLSAEINAAISASQFAASLPCTVGPLTTLNKSTTITGLLGTNVICVRDVVLNSATITLLGPPGTKFILNVTGEFVLNGGSHIVVAGGVQPKDVLYNIIGTGEDVALTGGGGGVNCCNSSVDGTLLALFRNLNLSPGLVNGDVIGGRNISIVSGSSVRCPGACTPVSVPNIITIDAQISEFQSNTNLNPACVFDVNGQPITTTSRCSALVECSPIQGQPFQGAAQ